MKKIYQKNQGTRRQFFSQIVHVSGLAFLGCPKLLAHMNASTALMNSSHKTITEEMYCQTYEKAFEWRYNHYIVTMEMLANYLGREHLIKLVKRSADDINKLSARNDPSLTLKDFAEPIMKSDFMKNATGLETIQYTDKLWELKVWKCLWAETFKKKNAADIGYATICYADFSGAKAFSPKLTLKRPEPSIMEGGECCHEFYIWEG